MFRRSLGVLALGSLFLASGVVASAQERAPHTGSTAVGFDVGMFVPKEPALDNALIVNVNIEYYLDPRVSLRTGFGLTDPGFANAGNDSLRQVPLHLDINYNWEGGKWHPFVGAGAGAYFLQSKRDGHSFGESETKPGFDFGGGVEYFTSRTVSLKGEARYQVIGTTRSGQDPSGLVLTGGLKKYW
jgi:hypothetical protein